MLEQIREKIATSAKLLSPITTEAQMYLESGYRPGQEMSTLASPPNHNLFGIKAGDPQFVESQKGKTWDWFWTKEWDGSKWIDVKAKFRIYPSWEASIEDHDNFFISTPARVERYRKTYEAKTLEEEVAALGASGYATDPKYAEKIMEIIKKYKLDEVYKDIPKFKKKETTKMAYIGIDIGHGKNSPARGGRNGWTGDEHGFNSKVAIKAKALLEDMGHKVTFGVQQPNSNEVGLSARTTYFNKVGVDVLISIHANAHSNTTVNGLSAFYDRYGTWRDAPSLKLAKSIMNEYRAQGHVIWSTGEVPSYRGNWTDFHMNRMSSMPSVLLELGFMTGNRDRDYVFGTKQPRFVEDMAKGIAIGVDRYFGGAGKVGSTFNPQGLKETTPVKYKAPRLPFKELKVGQKVTILDEKNDKGEYIWQWYDLENNKLLKSGKQKELAGKTDEIVEVKDIPDVQHSKVAYRLKNYNSWILEEYLLEPRADWDKVEEKPEDEGLQEGQFVLNGVKYQVSEIK